MIQYSVFSRIYVTARYYGLRWLSAAVILMLSLNAQSEGMDDNQSISHCIGPYALSQSSDDQNTEVQDEPEEGAETESSEDGDEDDEEPDCD